MLKEKHNQVVATLGDEGSQCALTRVVVERGKKLAVVEQNLSVKTGKYTHMHGIKDMAQRRVCIERK